MITPNAMSSSCTKSTAYPPTQTRNSRLGRALGGADERQDGKSGFLPVSDGVDALAIRLLLADQAEHCIDTQYYEIEDDFAGHLFMEALVRAADRGVRIRLLLDDYRTQGHDKGIAALRAHPKFEMRIYNPFDRRGARFLDALTSFARVNRRMHNKSFTVDNQFTVVGGRNIGDHYFSVGHDVNFADLDVVAIGPVVADVSTMFDDYWNSHAATPIDEIARRLSIPRVSVSKLLDRAARTRRKHSRRNFSDAIHASAINQLQHDLNRFTWADYELAYDLPQKTQKVDDAATIRRLLVRAFDEAEHEVFLVSPYFVPRLSGVRRFQSLRDRGIDVTVVSNSLASNNQIYAHGGYAPVRRSLLRMGVNLFEMRADARVIGNKSALQDTGRATLHTKAFAIDRQKLFIGSFNFDPRSANINTEMGVFIDSPAMATAFVTSAQYHTPLQAYEVRLSARGALQWHSVEKNRPVVSRKEPQAGFWRRLAGGAARLLPIRGQV